MARQLNQTQDWARNAPDAGACWGAGGPYACGYGRSPLPLFLSPDCSERNFRAQSDRNRIAVRAVAPTRGVIVDREGRLLAENLPSFTLALTPERISNLEEMLAELTELLDLSEDDIALFGDTEAERG